MKTPTTPIRREKRIDGSIPYYEGMLRSYRKRVALIGIFAGILIVFMLMWQLGQNSYNEANICVPNTHSGMYYALDGKTITIVLDPKNPEHRDIAQQVALHLRK